MASLPLISSAFTVEKFSLDIRVSACTFAERRHIYVGRNLKVQMLLFTAFPHLSCLLFIRKIVGLYKYLIKNETVDARAKLQWHKSTDSVRLRDFAACSSIQQHIQHFERKKKNCVASCEPVCNYKQHLVSDSMYGALHFVHWFAVMQR